MRSLSASANNLNLLVVARQSPMPGYPSVTVLVFDVCLKADSILSGTACPVVPAWDPFQGIMLSLEQQDTLSIRLINKLPTWPVNFHTHGLEVSPLTVSKKLGDNVQVQIFPESMALPQMAGVVSISTYADYAISIPSKHPMGLFWFHSHVHGMVNAQVGAGLSGMINVGALSNRISCQGPCPSVYNTILRSTHLFANGTLDYSQESACDPVAQSLDGFCDMVDEHAGGKIIFTLNGQQYPTITVNASIGTILTVVNAMGTYSTNLQLLDASSSKLFVFQVISLDGVTIRSSEPKSQCPNQTTAFCTDSLLMLPGTRAEVMLTYTTSSGNLPRYSSPMKNAILVGASQQMGPTGDSFPSFNLANVEFTAVDTLSRAQYVQVAKPFNASFVTSKVTEAGRWCAPLAAGIKRRFFFGIIIVLNGLEEEEIFSVGYDLVDEFGNVVSGSTRELEAYQEGNAPFACITLGSTESWDVINLSSEHHNFHIHQTRFKITKSINASDFAPRSSDVVDSVLMPGADIACESVSDYYSGLCPTASLRYSTISIPFGFAGNFPIHCHIAEHSDGGMMGMVEVWPATGQPSASPTMKPSSKPTRAPSKPAVG